MMMKTLFFPDAEEELIRADFSHSREVSAVADLAAVPEEDSEVVALADSAAAEVLAAVHHLVVDLAVASAADLAAADFLVVVLVEAGSISVQL